MDKANIIISIIIVLCIAAAVAAYGITNSDNPIFSDLSSMTANNGGNGLGNNTTAGNGSGHSPSSVATTNGGSGAGGASDGGASSGSSSSGSSYDSGSYNGGNSNSGSDSGSSSGGMSYGTAQSIANSRISEPGCYAGGGQYSNGMWIFIIYDENGNNVGTISVDANGNTGED
nr:endoglucanase [uncultured Methanobrevibacter sp.]